MKAGSLWEVSVEVAPEAEDAVAELLQRCFEHAASVETDAETGRTTATVYLEKTGQWNERLRVRLRKGLDAIRACGLAVGTGKVSARRIRREDWAESWKRHFKPLEIGPALLVRPSWSRRRARAGQSVVILDPGLSFGTGQHPTTQFCLEQLVAARKTDTSFSFLDMGTGSGILAIAAAKLGYRPVTGFDLDSDAVRVAEANAWRNRVSISLRQQDLTKLPARGSPRFDVICANLTADLLEAERHRIISQWSRRGRIVLAGLLRGQFRRVRLAYQGCGLRMVARQAVGEWESAAFATK